MSNYTPRNPKKSLQLYYDHSTLACKYLTDDAELGRLFRMIIQYEITRKDQPLPSSTSEKLEILYGMFKDDLDRNYDMWIESCEKQYKRATAGHGKPRQSTATAEADKKREDKRREDKRGKDKSTREGSHEGNIDGVMKSALASIKRKGDQFNE